MTAGIYWFDSAGNKLKIEYSTEVPPAVGATWTTVSECKRVARNPEASDQIPFTNYESTEKEFRTGLASRGSWDFGANFVPESASQAAIIALDSSKGERWWRITYPKADTTSTIAAMEMFKGTVETASIAPPDAEATTPVDFNWTVRAGGGYTFTPESAS